MADTFTTTFGSRSWALVAQQGCDVAMLSERLVEARSVGDLMDLLTHMVRALLQADGATFVVREGDRCRYADEDAVAPLWQGRRSPLNACLSGWCMIHGQAVGVADVQRDPRVSADVYRPTFVRSLAVAPVGRDEAVAALGAYWAEVRQTDPAELQLLQRIADAAEPVFLRLQRDAAPASVGGRAGANPFAPEPPEPTTEPAATDEAPAPHVSSLTRLRRDGLRQNSPAAYLFGAACALVATLGRIGIAVLGVGELMPLAIYFPAIVLAALLGGAGPGLLATALSAVMVHWVFAPAGLAAGPVTATGVLNMGLFLGSAALLVGMVHLQRLRLSRLKFEDARHLTLAREQQHRVENAIHVVESIVRQTLANDPVQARILNQRIRAGLSNIEIRYNWASRPIALSALLVREIRPFGLDRFILEGERGGAPLPPDAAGILTLAVHELATNALKYGALSMPAGRVTLSWSRDSGGARLRWREAGGPLVLPPRRRGYGTALLNRLLEASHGSIHTEYLPDGVVAEIVLPLVPGRSADG